METVCSFVIIDVTKCHGFIFNSSVRYYCSGALGKQGALLISWHCGSMKCSDSGECHQCNARGSVSRLSLISWLLIVKGLPGSVFMRDVSTLASYLFLLCY